MPRFDGAKYANAHPDMKRAINRLANNPSLNDRGKYLLGAGYKKRSDEAKNAWVRWFAIRQGRIAGRFVNNRWKYKIPKTIRDRVRGQLNTCVKVFDKAAAAGLPG